MTKSKFGMKAVPKTKKEENVEVQSQQRFYMPDAKLEVSGETMNVLLQLSKQIYQERVGLTIGLNGQIIGQTISPKDADIEQLLIFTQQLHKSFVEKGLTVSEDEFISHMKNEEIVTPVAEI